MIMSRSNVLLTYPLVMDNTNRHTNGPCKMLLKVIFGAFYAYASADATEYQQVSYVVASLIPYYSHYQSFNFQTFRLVGLPDSQIVVELCCHLAL